MYYICNTIILINNKNMRQILSLSMSENIAKEMKQNAKQKGFASVSAYIKYLFYLDKDLISEKDLSDSIKLARDEYDKGETIKAKSIADLI